MPAAAVIPAQIVYIKVVVVKKSTLLKIVLPFIRGNIISNIYIKIVAVKKSRLLKILLLYKKYFVD